MEELKSTYSEEGFLGEERETSSSEEEEEEDKEILEEEGEKGRSREFLSIRTRRIPSVRI